MDKAHLNRRLTRWGYFIGLQAAADGYPPESAINRIMCGSPPRPTSKILVLDLPPDVWRIQFAVRNLPEIYQSALIAHYALPPKDNGVMHTRRELADILRIHPETLRKRLSRGRRKLAYLLDLSRS